MKSGAFVSHTTRVLLLKIDWGGVLHLRVTLLPLVAGDFDATNQAHGKGKANDLPREEEQEEKHAKRKRRQHKTDHRRTIKRSRGTGKGVHRTIVTTNVFE